MTCRCLRLLVGMVVSLGLGLVYATPGSAQLPGTSTITGVVVDQATGSPMPNAVISIPAFSMAVLTASDGSFVMPGVTLGTQIVRVRQFGFEDFEVAVVVDGGQAPLDVRLTPDPLVLEGIEVSVDGALTVFGRVSNSLTGEPIPGVFVWIASVEDGVSTDSLGVFQLPRIPTGPQLVQVEHFGFGRQYIPVLATPPWASMEIVLEPDFAALEGIEAVESRLAGRRGAYRGVVEMFDADRLLSLEVETAWQVVQSFSFASLVPCQGVGPNKGMWCVDTRRDGLRSSAVCIDGELRLGGLDVLREYRPHELYLLEVFGVDGTSVRAYTHSYVETLSRAQLTLLEEGAGGQPGGLGGLGWSSRGADGRSSTPEDGGLVAEGALC